MSGTPVDILVIIPTCGRPRRLARAIASARGQEGVVTKIVVVDDDPAGSARKVVEAFADEAVIYVRHPHPSGGRPGRVRNYGFQSACDLGLRAELAHFLDDDDIAPAGWYAAAKRAFCDHPDIGVVFGRIASFGDDAARLEEDRDWRANAARVARLYQRLGESLGAPRLTRGLFTLQAMFGPELFLCSGGMIRHDAAAQLGGFDPDWRLMEDYEFYTRAIRRFGVRFIDQVSAVYRLEGADGLWNENMRAARVREIKLALALRQRRIRAEVGADLRFYAGKILYRALIEPIAYGPHRLRRLMTLARERFLRPEGSWRGWRRNDVRRLG